MMPEKILTLPVTTDHHLDGSITARIEGYDPTDYTHTTREINIIRGTYHRRDRLPYFGPEREIKRTNIEHPYSIYSLYNKILDGNETKRINAEVQGQKRQVYVDIYPSGEESDNCVQYRFFYGANGELKTAHVDIIDNKRPEIGAEIRLSPKTSQEVSFTVAQESEEEDMKFQRRYGAPLFLPEGIVFQVDKHGQYASVVVHDIRKDPNSFERASVLSKIDMKSFLLSANKEDNKAWQRGFDIIPVFHARIAQKQK